MWKCIANREKLRIFTNEMNNSYFTLTLVLLPVCIGIVLVPTFSKCLHIRSDAVGRCGGGPPEASEISHSVIITCTILPL